MKTSVIEASFLCGVETHGCFRNYQKPILYWKQIMGFIVSFVKQTVLDSGIIICKNYVSFDWRLTSSFIYPNNLRGMAIPVLVVVRDSHL